MTARQGNVQDLWVRLTCESPEVVDRVIRDAVPTNNPWKDTSGLLTLMLNYPEYKWDTLLDSLLTPEAVVSWMTLLEVLKGNPVYLLIASDLSLVYDLRVEPSIAKRFVKERGNFLVKTEIEAIQS